MTINIHTLRDIIFIISTFAISCQTEEPELALPNEKTLVVNGFLTTDSLIALNVSSSIGMSDTLIVQDNLFNDAIVSIKQDNLPLDTLMNRYMENVPFQFFDNLPNNYYSTLHTPKQNKTYTVTVIGDNYNTATAEVQIPYKVNIDKLDTAVVELTGQFEDWESNIRLKCDILFNDPLEYKNYYLVDVSVDYYENDKLFTSYNNGPFPFECNDPIVEEHITHGSYSTIGVVFSDKIISGKQYKVSIVLNGKDIGEPFYSTYESSCPDCWEPNKTVIYFKLFSITEDYFKYIQTLNKFTKNIQNPLSEPVQVHSNIQGGLGIIGGAAVSTDSLVFKY